MSRLPSPDFATPAPGTATSTPAPHHHTQHASSSNNPTPASFGPFRQPNPPHRSSIHRPSPLHLAFANPSGHQSTNSLVNPSLATPFDRLMGPSFTPPSASSGRYSLDKQNAEEKSWAAATSDVSRIKHNGGGGGSFSVLMGFKSRESSHGSDGYQTAASKPHSVTQSPPPTHAIDLPSLRALVDDAIHKHLYRTAIFYADKVVTLSGSQPWDIYLLARCYYLHSQYKRAVHTVKTSGLMPMVDATGAIQLPSPDVDSTTENTHELPFLQLAIQCLIESSDWDEALAIQGSDDDVFLQYLQRHISIKSPLETMNRWSFGNSSPLFTPKPPSQYPQAANGRAASTYSSSTASSSPLDTVSSVCCLRGRVYEAVGNTQRAIAWYKHALSFDVRCYDAFEQLIDKRMLGQDEEWALVQRQLHFPPETEWLKLLYLNKIQQYATGNNGSQYNGAASLEMDGMHDNESIEPSTSDELLQRIEILETDYGLADNLELQSSLATHYYFTHNYQRAYELSKAIIDVDPYTSSVLPVHLCSLVELDMRSELFYSAHQLVVAYPSRAIAWFAVGCYYYCIGRYEVARRYFHKSTQCDSLFLPALLAFAHTYALMDETDQALIAYRTAARLFPGSYLPLLYVGMEYSRTHNLLLAKQFIQQAAQLNSSDPLIAHELGVIAYKQGEYISATKHFRQSLQAAGVPHSPDDADNHSHNELTLSGVEGGLNSTMEATLFNLGHCYRKQQQYAAAIHTYKRALLLSPQQSSIHTAIGFTYMLDGDMGTAIQWFHTSLQLAPRHLITVDLLQEAIAEDGRLGLQ